MIHSANAGANRSLDPILAVCVRRDLLPPAACLVHGGLNLRVGILLRAGRNPLREHRTGRKNLDEIRAVLQVRPHYLPHLVDTVGEVADDRDVHVDRELARVTGAAGRRDVVAGDL